jgi:hypothetical protein
VACHTAAICFNKSTQLLSSWLITAESHKQLCYHLWPRVLASSTMDIFHLTNLHTLISCQQCTAEIITDNYWQCYCKSSRIRSSKNVARMDEKKNA